MFDILTPPPFLFYCARTWQVLGDTHVYKNHVEALKVQLEREPRPFPTLTIARQVDSIDDFTADDFVIDGYKPHKKIAMEMAV